MPSGCHPRRTVRNAHRNETRPLRDSLAPRGRGIVYRALDTRLDREVALNVLPPELVADPERLRRFEREARAASKLEHPNIAVIHEIGEADGVTFLTMELIRGEKLADRLLEARLPWTRALEIATEIGEGLARAHERGVVHRDLKPANVMVREDGHPKIIDLGLAKLVAPLSGEEGESATRSARDTEPGVVLGTFRYMSLEQARGGRLDHRTDVFSFGVVLVEMLSGRRPFDGASQLEILQAIVSAPTPRLALSLSESSSKIGSRGARPEPDTGARRRAIPSRGCPLWPRFRGGTVVARAKRHASRSSIRVTDTDRRFYPGTRRVRQGILAGACGPLIRRLGDGSKGWVCRHLDAHPRREATVRNSTSASAR